MTILITGSSGHLGHALMHALSALGRDAVGIDVTAAPWTQHVGSIVDREFVRECMRNVTAVVHTATLHKPHVATHSRQAFVDTNITGTLNLLEEAAAAGVRAFVFTSTTSTFGHALVPAHDQPAAWITEAVAARPKNIYGVTKLAAENLCELFHRRLGLPCVILRTARFFPEADDDREQRDAYADANLKVNELLYRRADIEDIVGAHLAAIESAPSIGFDCFVISATTPVAREDLVALRHNAPEIIGRYVPEYVNEYARRGWRMFPTIDRVYSNERARKILGWQPRFDFAGAVARLRADMDYRSELARIVGSKGYHAEGFGEGPYPVD